MRHNRLVNLTGQEYKDFLLSPQLLDCYRHTRARKRGTLDEALCYLDRYFTLESVPEQSWTEEQSRVAARRVHLIERLRRQSVLLRIDGEPSRRLLTLRALGHDPERSTPITEAEVLSKLRIQGKWWCPDCVAEVTEVELDEVAEDWCCSCGAVLTLSHRNHSAVNELHRWLDATPGSAPHRIGIDEVKAGRCGLNYGELQKTKVPLTPEERKEVMQRKAVWHHGPKGEESPAVWKSVRTDKTWYITNTHRAMACARTLSGAIKKYHDFIKSTS